jgi:tight adherence protein C
MMPLTLTISLAAVFICVATAAGWTASAVLAWSSPERKRLRSMTPTAASELVREDTQLVETPNPALRRLSLALPKSPKELGRLRRQLMAAGYPQLSTAVYFAAIKLVTPMAAAVVVVALFGVSDGWMLAAIAAALWYVLPDLWLTRKTRARAKAIENGLPDALDLMIVCIEAGSSLDQAIVKASDELEITHPALAGELRMITTEIRAGKTRLDAFTNFALRTKVPDVRSLVTMLTQTDRFGTSIAQALRIHADTSRTKRRQRAEERAAKIGVKLVFPLVLCIFPAVYVVCIGSAVIEIYRGLF